jgi:hypothetical protein
VNGQITVNEPITWYDVLGVSGGASAVTLRRAHDERRLQLRSYFLPPSAMPSSGRPGPQLAGAPPVVVSAAARATEAVEAAWLVLGDTEQRNRYDAQLGRLGPRGRRLTVPDVRGLFYRPCQEVVVMAGLRPAVIRLTQDPLPVEGLVVGQSPDPGATVRYQSTLTVQVWHPSRSR